MKTNYKSLDNNIWLSDEEKQEALSYVAIFQKEFKGYGHEVIDCIYTNMYGMNMICVIYDELEKSTRKVDCGFGNKSVYYASSYVYNLDYPALSEAGTIQVIKHANHLYRIG